MKEEKFEFVDLPKSGHLEVEMWNFTRTPFISSVLEIILICFFSFFKYSERMYFELERIFYVLRLLFGQEKIYILKISLILKKKRLDCVVIKHYFYGIPPSTITWFIIHNHND